MSGRFAAATWIGIGCVSAVLLSACASTSSVPAPDLMTRASAEATRYLEAGDYQGALNVLKTQLRAYPGNKEWEAEVAASLDEIHGIAESAFRRRNYARAERIYRLLLDHYDDFEQAAVEMTFRKGGLESGIRSSRISLIDQAAGQAMQSGDPGKALDVYAEGFKEFPGVQDLTAGYLRAVRELKAAGDRALAGKDFARAGTLHRLLLQRFPTYERMAPRVPFGKPDLEAALAICRDGLTKAGLAEYRSGNLAKAIALWEALLAFDPGNAEIKKAAETARTQLKGIEKKKGAGS